MAITRALLPKQLEAGAPDLRLTGDQRDRGTYTQRRRDQMAYGGIAGLDGRKRYGIGSWFQEKIMDPIKKNPVATALTGGALLNQFGLPSIPGLDTKGMGQNWLGELLGGVVPGNTQFNTVLGDKIPFSYQDITSNPLPGGIDQIAKDYIIGDGFGGGNNTSGFFDYEGDAYGTTSAATDINNLLKQQAMESIKKQIDPNYISPTRTSTGQEIRWKTPLAIGTAIGAADAATRKDHQLPTDPSINIPQTAQAAMADPNLRFKPPLEATQLAAEGGRIGYSRGLMAGIGTALPPEKPEYITKKSDTNDVDTMNRIYEEQGQEGLNDYIERNPHFNDKYVNIYMDYDSNEIKAVPNELYNMEKETMGVDGSNIIINVPENRAEGGRIGYNRGRVVNPGGYAGDIEIPEQFLEDLKRKNLHKMLDEYRRFQEDYERRRDLAPTQEAAQGGRIGFNSGGFSAEDLLVLKKHKYNPSEVAGWKDKGRGLLSTLKSFYTLKADGGRIGADEGGLMNLGGMEKDYRQEGGFVPLGGEEKADDVPARLSKNEFVFTADAVRAAGGGDIDQGAAVMENLMENLEAGGKVSEESQGLEGAREMFANAQELQKRII